MKCTACGCPGAYQLLRQVVCWNQDCRNYHSDVVSGSDFSKDNKFVNGDSIEELKEFLDRGDGDEVPEKFLKWKK
jgi:hypothetical protein